MLQMYGSTFNALTVTHPFPKLTRACLAPFLLPANQSFSRLAWQRLQAHVVHGP